MKKFVGIILAFLLGIGLIGCSADADANHYNALYYTTSLKSAGFPIDNIIEYTEETDVNGLLGRPGEYISKVNFADTRIDQYDPADPLGGTIEVFSSKGDMEKRKEYLEGFAEESSLLGDYYIYVSPDNLAIMRIDFDLTPTQADEYNNAFVEICESGEATPVDIEVAAPVDIEAENDDLQDDQINLDIPEETDSPLFEKDQTPEEMENNIFTVLSTYAMAQDEEYDLDKALDIMDIQENTALVEDPEDARHFSFAFENSTIHLFTDEEGIVKMACVELFQSDLYQYIVPSVLIAFEPDHVADALDLVTDHLNDYIYNEGEPIAVIGETDLIFSLQNDTLLFTLIKEDALLDESDYYTDSLGTMINNIP